MARNHRVAGDRARPRYIWRANRPSRRCIAIGGESVAYQSAKMLEINSACIGDDREEIGGTVRMAAQAS